MRYVNQPDKGLSILKNIEYLFTSNPIIQRKRIMVKVGMDTMDQNFSSDRNDAINLLAAAEFSATGPVKKDLMKNAGSNIVIVGIKPGR